MARLDAIRTAARPKMFGRAMISGPSGAGKTYTSLSIARTLNDGDLTRTLVIDTEHESALTYADVFPGFAHLPWRPPFDPGELQQTLAELDDTYATVIVDSFTHFWRGQGGTLDIADGKIGGWKAARPVQESLVQGMLGTKAHLILCVRSKMEYLIEGGGGSKQTVTKMGLAPVQDETLIYEMNVGVDIDLEHRITVTKSRTTAVPVGRMYPAGLEAKLAGDYADWLAGGIPPADKTDVDEVIALGGQFADAEVRKRIGGEFKLRFGMPHSLTADKVAEAKAWLQAEVIAHDAGDVAEHTAEEAPHARQAPPETPAATPAATAAQETPQPASDDQGGRTDEAAPGAVGDEAAAARQARATEVQAAEETKRADREQATTTGPTAAPDPAPDRTDAVIAEVSAIPDKRGLVIRLTEAGLATSGTMDTLRKRLAEYLLAPTAA